MRYAAILLLPLLFICSCASTPASAQGSGGQAPAAAEDSGGQAPAPEPEPEKQRLAVLDMEDTTGDIDAESLTQATDYLRVLVVQSQRFIVVNDEEKQALIRELRKRSHGEQYDESQQVALGEQVAANTALISTILKIQEEYILKAELVDLAKEAIIAGATEKFNPGTFQQAIEAVAQAMTTEKELPKEAPADTAVAVAPAEEATAEEAPIEQTSVTTNYAGNDRDYHGGGVNFIIIDMLWAHPGHPRDPYYERAAQRRHEREEAWRREHAEHQHHADEPTHHHANGPTHEHIDGAMREEEAEPPADAATPPSVEKPIKFKLVKKPILFRAPAQKQPSSGTTGQQPSAVTVRPNAVQKKETPAPVYTIPSKREKETAPAPVFRIEPKKSEPTPAFRAEPKKSEPTPAFRVEPKKSEPTFSRRTETNDDQPSQPSYKKQSSPMPIFKKSEPAATPRPIFTPSKSVTPTPSSNSSSSKKKKDDDKDDDDDDKKKEKKKPSTGNIFMPRKR